VLHNHFQCFVCVVLAFLHVEKKQTKSIHIFILFKILFQYISVYLKGEQRGSGRQKEKVERRGEEDPLS